MANDECRMPNERLNRFNVLKAVGYSLAAATYTVAVISLIFIPLHYLERFYGAALGNAVAAIFSAFSATLLLMRARSEP